MSYRVFLMDRLPVLVFEAGKDYSAAADLEKANVEILDLLDNSTKPVYHLVDMRNSDISFEDVQLGANAAGRGPNPIFRHSKVKQVMFVTQNPMLKLAVEGMQSDIYGNVTVLQFDTMDEALAHIRADMG